MTKRPIWLSLCLILSLLLPTPIALAQDGGTASPTDGTNATKVFIPFVSNTNRATNTAEAGTEEEESAEELAAEDEIPAVTALTVPTTLTEVTAAGSHWRVLSDQAGLTPISGAPTIENALALRKVNPALRLVNGKQQVVVRLQEPSVTEQMAQSVTASAVDAQLAQLARVATQQSSVVQLALRWDANARVLAQVQKALNAVILEVDGTALASLAADPAVLSINPVINYEKALTETVPYIGGTAAQQAGYDGTGVKVAVLDSGIDYTHANLGGPGTREAYELAYGATITDSRNTTRDGLFPTANVVEGYDFVGELWPNGPLAPDDDPIDAEGHGTHVADIIGGNGGVAPGVELYAVKVCATLSSSCSGVALLQAMDYIVDPNDDGDLSDHVDIVNLSLGSNYGLPYDDDLAFAIENTSSIGVLTVASAGNGGDRPYITGTPAAAPSALSVAQTQVPSAIGLALEVVAPASAVALYEAVYQPWSAPLTAVIEAPLQYGDGAGGNLNGCSPFAAGTLTGKIVLVDRGTCNISLKISNVAEGGGLVGIIGLVAPGDPSVFSFGGGVPSIPGYNISQSASQALKRALATGESVIVRFDPAGGVSLIGQMVGSSSRGPSMTFNEIKPEIGAPGAAVSAIAGTGTGVEPFGGTSGAAPVVSGAAALVIQKYPERTPAEIKALLMNSAETNILVKPTLFGGTLAEISRIGGGEVRVDKALTLPAAAWNAASPTAALSFTFHDITREKKVLKQVVTIRNYSDRNIRYELTPAFRFAEDAASGAIEINTPDDLMVRAHSDRQFEVTMIIRGEKLPAWRLNSGSAGASAATLTAMEFDGYLLLTEEGNPSNQLHLPWQILPRKAGDVTLKSKSRYVQVRNRGVGTSLVESYSLIGVSDNLPEGGPGENNPTPDIRYVGYTTIGVPAGFCSEQNSFLFGFAFNSWERQTHANLPAGFEIDFDIDQDGEFDFAIFTLDLAGNWSDGRNAVWVQNLATGASYPSFYTDHETNSANTVLYTCAEDIGLSWADVGRPIDVWAGVYDYWSGTYTDWVEGMTIAPGGERYVALFEEGGVGATELGYKTNDKLRILDTGSTTNNTELGLLLLYRGGTPEGAEAGVISIK
ncbi:MAG: S8 family serine peptidase [Caldilineaceae bacterium]|nr:S8 family serine peptidase [Caldilineaceae bacterium]